MLVSEHLRRLSDCISCRCPSIQRAYRKVKLPALPLRLDRHGGASGKCRYDHKVGFPPHPCLPAGRRGIQPTCPPKVLFSTRSQTITAYKFELDSATVGIDYEGVLRADLPNGPRAGQILKLKGTSTFRFRDGLIYELIDQS
jgi:hypothetical protein